MSRSKEEQIQDLLEDIDTQKFIHDDLVTTRPGDAESIAETMQQIKILEDKVARLLGLTPDDSPAVSSDPSTASASAMSSTSATPPVREDPWRARPSYLPPAPPQMSPQLPLRTGTIPANPTSAPYWPSSAPSPFAVQSRYDTLPSPAAISMDTRKRVRQDSGSSPIFAQPPKRTAMDRSAERIAKIKVEMREKLSKNKLLHDAMRMPENIRLTMSTSRMSEAEALQEVDEEEKENERSIRMLAQLEEDEELARRLQAEDEFSDHEQNSIPRSPFQPPDANRNGVHFEVEPPPIEIPPKLEPGIYPPMSNSFRSRTLSDSDSDLEEISADHYRSRFGDMSMNMTSRTLPPPTPAQFIPGRHLMPMPRAPMPLPGQPYTMQNYPHFGRTLPWEDERHHELRAFDLVREQQELDDDDVDFEQYQEQQFPEDIKNLLVGIKDINAATKADKDDTPAGLKVTLMKHQKIGVAWLKAKEESKHKGGILADDMGLGKTIQAIALMVARPPTDPERHPSLIVAPKALMDQWRLEIERHIKPGKHQLSVFIFHDKTRNVSWKKLQTYDVVITTFGTLTANYKLLTQADKLEQEGKDASLVKYRRDQAILYGASSKWHRVIVDEAQNIKNPAAKSNKACCRLNAEYRWCLTGTPMMNRLEDFQSLLGFLRIRPYNNKDKFKRDFVRPIKSGYGDDNTMQQLRVLVKSVCLRRTKTSKIDGQPILQLPPRVVEKVHVVFNEKENEIYQALSSSSQNQITRYLNAGTLGRNYSHVLVLLLRLRQACCHPQLMQGFNTETPTNVQGVDLLANAKLLASEVVERIKNRDDDEDDGTCPICMDSVGNAVIYIPCGHSVCSECFARISDPAVQARDDVSGLIKCQNCRGPVDPVKITDANSFKKAWDPSPAPESSNGANAEESAATTESESSDHDSDTDSSDKPQKKSFAELRTAAQKNKKEKKKYLRRLEKTWTPSSKIDKAMEILQANEERGQGEKTIIFSQFTSLLDLLEVPINRRGWGYVRFDGSMNVAERNASVTNFTQDPNCKIMLVSLKAGNAGLNLVAASHVILFDPFWNPFVEEQAIDRAHRIGQTKEVFVHRLLIENTVEDRICELQEKKRDLIGGALDERGVMNVSRLDTRELAYLFGVQA
ncbi:hypothetical protein N7492_006783 [Penicillium capsulatum]|uniref:Uncharacterized protein n=1 Tax=Penicillium capsulatum TaxID=69766 RepID=A0A9W9I130_9EURO|nr:hypothetical protein N7492_006783 [Penicillium capsulatum]KAJ6116619.1 hypothetical protein N7512_006344 [Penicillium capsulatum]